MIKISKVLLITITSVVMTSCYTSKVVIGNEAVAATRTVEISRVKNPSLISGLIPLKKAYNVKDYVGDRENYIIKNRWTLVDGVLNYVTFGLYSPTTTSFHIPLEEKK